MIIAGWFDCYLGLVKSLSRQRFTREGIYNVPAKPVSISSRPMFFVVCLLK